MAVGLHTLHMAVRDAISQSAGTAFAMLCISQFHLAYYASRPLPNTFALVLCCVASASWLRSRHPRRVVLLLTASAVGFCCLHVRFSVPLPPHLPCPPLRHFWTLPACDQLTIVTATMQAVFRCDVAPLLALVGLHLMWTGQLSAAWAVADGVVALCGCVAATAPLDSLLWQRLLWPESEVFWFNIVLNR